VLKKNPKDVLQIVNLSNPTQYGEVKFDKEET
jgi:hypothetical protein